MTDVTGLGIWTSPVQQQETVIDEILHTISAAETTKLCLWWKTSFPFSVAC